MRTSLVRQATDMAVRRCPVEEGVTILAARTGAVGTRLRGSWTASGPVALAPRWGVRGCDWVGAWAESFNATLKNERVHRMVYPTKDKAVGDIASWIELRHNHVRLHSALGYRTPNETEHELLGLTKAA